MKRREETILDWIRQNYPLITALTGIGTLLVWIVYLQVFVSSYHRQLRAKILITRGAGDGLDAHCFISNMSAGPVYVQSIIVTLQLAGTRWVCPVTDLLDLEEEEAPLEPRLRTRQGPLSTGDIKDVGTFRSLVRHVIRQRRGRSADVELQELRTLAFIQIEVLGAYGSEDLLIGARRNFEVIAEGDGIQLRGEKLTTEQIRKRRDREKLIDLLKQDR